MQLGIVEELWDEKPFDEKKGLVTLLIKKIIWKYLSPRFYKLTIEWKYKEWGTEEAIFDRKHVGSKPWTEQEEETIRHLYPNGEQMDILQQLPNRTWRGISVEASKLGVSRKGKPVLIEMNLSYRDMQFLQQSTLTLADFSYGNQTIWSQRRARYV